MLADGTLESALCSALEKLQTRNKLWNRGDYEVLQEQDRFYVKGSPFDVAVALDWKTYHRHVYTEKCSTVGQKREKRTNGETKNGVASLAARSEGIDTEDRAFVASSIPLPPLYSVPYSSVLPSELFPLSSGATHPAMLAPGLLVDGVVSAGIPPYRTQELSSGIQRQEGEMSERLGVRDIGMQELASLDGTSVAAAEQRD